MFRQFISDYIVFVKISVNTLSTGTQQTIVVGTVIKNYQHRYKEATTKNNAYFEKFRSQRFSHD